MNDQTWKEPENGPLVDITMTYDRPLLLEFASVWTKQQKKTKIILFCTIAIIICAIMLCYGLIRKNILCAYFGGLIAGIVILLIAGAVQEPKKIAHMYEKTLLGETLRMKVFPDFISSLRDSERYVGQNKYRYEAIEHVYEGEGLFCLLLKGMFQIIDKRSLSREQISVLRQLFTQKLGEKFKGLDSKR